MGEPATPIPPTPDWSRWTYVDPRGDPPRAAHYEQSQPPPDDGRVGSWHYQYAARIRARLDRRDYVRWAI